MKKLIVISNDKISFSKKEVSADFNDTINIIEALSKKKYLNFISKKTQSKRLFKVKVKNKSIIKISQIKNLNLDNEKVFMISITPFNFLIFLIINYFHKKINGYVILRSDGFKEYHSKFGLFGKNLYYFFFKIILKKLKPIVVTRKLSNISRYKTLNIFPSEISNVWKKNLKKANLSKAKILYLGRIKKEKGIYSLLKLTENLSINYNLSIVGDGDKINFKNDKVKIFNQTSNLNKIIKFYDQNNIFILPSFTEGSPKVILESLSRLRPIIVFEEISHVKRGMRGIYVCKRNSQDLQKTIEYVLNNYKFIQSQMKKNLIPTKEQFQKDLIKIVK